MLKLIASFETKDRDLLQHHRGRCSRDHDGTVCLNLSRLDRDKLKKSLESDSASFETELDNPSPTGELDAQSLSFEKKLESLFVHRLFVALFVQGEAGERILK